MKNIFKKIVFCLNHQDLPEALALEGWGVQVQGRTTRGDSGSRCQRGVTSGAGCPVPALPQEGAGLTPLTSFQNVWLEVRILS